MRLLLDVDAWMPVRAGWWGFAWIAGLVLQAVTAHASSNAPPRLVLWAWERREDLRFIDPATTEVAFLAGTVRLHGASVTATPRLQPLRVPDATRLTAVVRVESRDATLDDAQVGELVAAIARLGAREGIGAVQVDFDATLSQRAAYAGVLARLRPRLLENQHLGMTALASWCLFDDWIARLPPGLVDEVVPMAFRMGRDDARVRRELARGPLRCAACRHAIGVAVDEPVELNSAPERVYAFNPRSWTPEDVERVRAGLAR